MARRDPALDFRRTAPHGTDPLRVTKVSFAVLPFFLSAPPTAATIAQKGALNRRQVDTKTD
jgi:hypothetical protein